MRLQEGRADSAVARATNTHQHWRKNVPVADTRCFTFAALGALLVTPVGSVPAHKVITEAASRQRVRDGNVAALCVCGRSV